MLTNETPEERAERTGLFTRAPFRAIIDISPAGQVFCGETGFTFESQQYSEVLRQVFDVIGLGQDFDRFQDMLKRQPIFDMLLDSEKYYGETRQGMRMRSALGEALSRSVQKLGMACYMVLVHQGFILNDDTPYVLETVQRETLLLYNTLNTVYDTTSY